MTTFRPHPSSRAFTLLEVLLAVAIFAIVLAAVNTVFYGAMRLRNKTAAAIERMLPIEHALSIIKRDLAGIVPPGGAIGGILQSGASSSTLLMGRKDSYDFYTATARIDENIRWAEVQKVTYYLSRSTNVLSTGGQDLYRAATRNLLASEQEVPQGEFLLSHVRHIQFLFYSGTEWRDSWDSTSEETPLPKAIKVLVQFEPEEDARFIEEPVQLVVPIMVEAGTNSTQTAGGQR